MRYRRNLQKQADDLQRKLEERKDDTTEKAKTHDRMRATIGAIKNVENKLRAADDAKRSELKAWRRLSPLKQGDTLARYSRTAQSPTDRVESSWVFSDREDLDKLRDKLKEIEAIIQNIDSRIQGPARWQRQVLIDDFRAEQQLRHQEMTAERQALQLNAKEIERKLQKSPDRKDAEKLLMELEQIKLRIQEIDKQQPGNVLRQFQPDLRDEYEAKRKKLLTLRRQSEDREKQIELKFEQAPDTEDADKLLTEIDQINKMIREIDSELSSPEWCAEKRKTLRYAKPKDHRPTEKLKSDSSCSSCHEDVEHIEVYRKPKPPAIPEHEPHKTTPPPLIPPTPVRREPITTTPQQGLPVLATPVPGATTPSPLSPTPPVRPTPARREPQTTTRQPGLPVPATPVPRVPTTTPPLSPTPSVRPTPAQAENLQHRINQLQDEMTRLRSEIAAMRRLLTDLVEHEKKRSKQSILDTGTLEREKSRSKQSNLGTENLVEDEKQHTDHVKF